MNRSTFVTIGTDVLTKKPFKIDISKHTIIQGGSGVGKSTLIANICIQIIWKGGGLCLIDPHGDVVDTILRYFPRSRMRDLILWDPSQSRTPPFNPLYFKNPEDLQLVKEALHSLLKYLAGDAWGPETDRVIVNALNAITEYFPIATVVHLFRFLADDEFREFLLSRTKDPTLRMFAEQYDKLGDRDQMAKFSPAINKVGKLLHSAILSSLAQLDSLEPLEIMNRQLILICRFSKGRLGEEVAQVLGSLVIALFAIAALQRESQEIRPDFPIIVDEIPTFIGAGGPDTILAEGRKYGTSLVSGFQGLYQMESLAMDFLANASNQIVLNSSGQDAKLIAENWGSDTRANEIVKLKRYTFIARKFENDNPKIRLVTSARPMRPRRLLADPEKLIKQSLDRWSKERSESERKVFKFLTSPVPKPKPKRKPKRPNKSKLPKNKKRTKKEIAEMPGSGTPNIDRSHSKD